MSVASPELAIIERELTRPSLKLGFRDVEVERRYLLERQLSARTYHWASLLILVAIYDAFLIAELSAAPEIVELSAWLRFAFLTPAALAYVLLDWRCKLGRWSGPIFATLIVAPTLVSAIESQAITNPAILYAFQTTPLLQLAVLTCRMGVIQAAFANAAHCAIYITAVLATSIVPSAMVPSLLLTDGAIGIAVLVFTVRMDMRDRQVFLFNRQAEIRGQILVEQNNRLARLTQIDALTGLGNRRCFDETLANFWADARVRHADITLIIFDIDCFKLFNDALGHQAGDECLITLSHTLTRCLRDERDTLVRYGGEEFAVVLPSTSLAEGWSVAERIREAVVNRAVPHPLGTPAGFVTVSLGVAAVKPADCTAAALIEAADRCLYAAKRAGRNRTVTLDMLTEPLPLFDTAPLVDDKARVD